MTAAISERPPVPRASDRICASCQGQAAGFGVVAKWQDEILWACGDPDCYLAITGTYKMPSKEFKHLETLAAEIGGQEGGEYLDEIGKTDLGELEVDEYAEYVRRVIGGYRFALHETLRNESPF